MNIKNIIITAIAAVIWIGPAVAAGTSPVLSVERSLYPADADQELDQFFKAKEFLFLGDWPQARKRLEKFLKDFPDGRMRDEALFWLAKSLSGCAARETSFDAAAALKKEAFRTLERLGREHPESPWKDDAEAMRIEIAGELVLLGAKEYEGFIHEYAASQKTDETMLKLTALNSLIRLEPETAFTALVSGLEKEPDPRIRKKCATLLGQNYTEEAVPVLEKASRSDQDPDVRTEAAYWTGQIRMRMIPADMSYYLLAARVTGDAARGRIKENVVNRFSIARKPTGASGARRMISQFFDNQVGEFKSAASSERAANAFMSQLEMSISHRIHDFQVSIIPGSIRKSPGRVTGEILFIDRVSGARLSETFAVDGRNDQIIAARRGDEAAVMLIQFEPVAGGAPAEAEDEGGSSAIGRLMSRIFGGRSADEPVYSTFYTNFMGCRVHSTLQSTATDNLKSNIQDFSLAKVEIPAKGEAKGTWVLTGHILGLKKERTFKARQASLIDPTGRISAVADEITVAVDDPAGFRVQGSRLADKGVAEMVKKAKITPPPVPESRGETEAREQTCELENGIKVFYSAAEKIGAAELGGPLVEFGRARVEITVPEGTWVLSGTIRLISSGSLFYCENSTLTDPRGNVRAKDAKLLVPMKKPHQYTLIDAEPRKDTQVFGIRQATSVFRGLRRQKGYIIINIAGLAVGLASAMLIALWVGDELGFDRFHRDSDRIYRIMSEGGKYQWKNMRGTPAPLAEAISREIPEVERAARFATTPRVVFQSGTKAMYEERGLIADPSLFEIFSFPFALSILLVLCTAVLFRQMRFVRNAELGFDKDNVVIVPVKENIGKSYDAFKAALLAEPAVSGVTAQSYMFSDTNWRTTDFDWEGRDPNHIQDLVISPVDADFFETLDMEIVQGRGFSGVRESGGTTAFVLNEAAVKAMRLDAPVGKWFSASRRQGVIVGIVRDAHLRSFRERIEPRVFWVIRSPMEMREGVVLFKIRTPSRRDAPRAVDSALAAARRAWENINAVTPFEFRFLDDHYNSLYKNESRIGALLNIFAGMAVLIAGLGLFGLSSFLAERRTKEIGIRKILGASGPSLLRLMSGEFVRLAAVANVLVWPVGYLAMDKILRNFAYRVRISPIEFAAAALVSLSLAVAAVSAPLRRAAGTDPARALRYE